ncbi:hypothetical protein GC194_05215 [bacterium]|nr:hypothetical protein [bacterium]
MRHLMYLGLLLAAFACTYEHENTDIGLDATTEELSRCTADELIEAHHPKKTLEGNYDIQYIIKQNKDCVNDTTFVSGESIKIRKQDITFLKNDKVTQKVAYDLIRASETTGPYMMIKTENNNSQIDGSILACCNGILKIKNTYEGQLNNTDCAGAPPVVVLLEVGR